jgi:hypothetical protein
MNSSFYCYSLNSGGDQQPYIASRSHGGWDVSYITVENRTLDGALSDSPEISLVVFDTTI